MATHTHNAFAQHWNCKLHRYVSCIWWMGSLLVDFFLLTDTEWRTHVHIESHSLIRKSLAKQNGTRHGYCPCIWATNGFRVDKCLWVCAQTHSIWFNLISISSDEEKRKPGTALTGHHHYPFARKKKTICLPIQFIGRLWATNEKMKRNLGSICNGNARTYTLIHKHSSQPNGIRAKVKYL